MTGPAGSDRAAGRALAELLRTWWELSAREGRAKPTQQSLALRLGIDQTTLSRYLNPNHPSTAPLRVVEQLHTALRAPEADLPRARTLAETAATAPPRKTPRPSDAPVTPAPGAPDTPPLPHRRRPSPALLAVLALLVLALGGGIGLGVSTLSDRGAAEASDAGPPAVTAHPAASRWPLARKGDLLWKARTVQYLLQAHGYAVAADGDFGPGTAAAVKKFQSAHGLLPDGKVGDDTWPLLIITVDAHKAPEQAVRALQYLLHNAGHPTDNTGTFTPSTRRSLQDFQRTQGLPVTGTATDTTWHALLTSQGPAIHR